MTLRALLFALVMICRSQAQDGIPTANATAGKAAWDARLCKWCHGEQGEGGFGPDLAGRSLSFGQFKHAVRNPWGVMPAFTEGQVSDQNLADISAYLVNLPRVPEPAAWRERLPPQDAPRGQVLLIANGCAQCHGPELTPPRMVLGGEASDLDFTLFAKMVYEHTELYPRGRMGNFSRLRLQESTLQEIFRFATQDLGLLVPLAGRIDAGVPAGANTTYTLTVKNQGAKGKGLTAQEVTVVVALPSGNTVVGTSGIGYQGVIKDPTIKSDAAVWRLSGIAPQEEQIFTFSVSGTGGVPAELFKGSVVRWAKPEIRKGVPNLGLHDPRIPGKDPQIAVTFPPLAQAR
jgi:mono/diheme cytochrome c family protein